MDLSKTRLIESIFAGGGQIGARMRTVDWSAKVLGPLLSASAHYREADVPLLRSGFDFTFGFAINERANGPSKPKLPNANR